MRFRTGTELGGKRQSGVSTDELAGRTADGPVRLRFDTIRSIVRRTGDSALVTLLDGRQVVLSGTREVGAGNGGIYADDRRYGRVLVSWGAFERLDFSAAGDSGPAYTDFPQGRPLTGTVTTRSGQRLTGRLVYDLDESETTETLDAGMLVFVEGRERPEYVPWPEIVRIDLDRPPAMYPPLKR